MTLKCDNCQTRFKVADQQISERGTWVRCSKCQYTFQVSRPDGAGALNTSDPSALAEELFGDLVESAGEKHASGPPGAIPRLPPAPAEALPSLEIDVQEGSTELLPDLNPPQRPGRELLPPPEQFAPPPPFKDRPLAGTFLQPSQKIVGAPSRVGWRKLFSGVLVNLGVAAALLTAIGGVGLLYASKGKLDRESLSWQRLKQLLEPPREMAVDLANGLYDTRAGKPVFYVRGEAENRGPKPVKLLVRADILDDSQLVRSAEVWAGMSATPEDLFNIASAADADSLTARLNLSAVEVSPGQRAPFLLTFFEYPPSLSGFQIKVTVSAGEEKTAAR
jgi:predicted Zn finger-like uncharacterized protein